MKPTLRIYKDPAELALKAARHFSRLADQYVLGNGRFTVALAGGSTPRAMYSLLAEEPFLDTLPWNSVFFFFGDERTVPPDHPESNFRMAREALLSKVPVPDSNVFRIAGEEADPHAAAARYSEQLESFFAPDAPRLDLVLLGMGTDGHTASLFPHSAALKSREEYVAANFVEQFQSHRITLTAKTINLARNVTFLVSGYDKAEALHRVIEDPFSPEELPSQLIRPNDGGLLWMVDEAAQSLLQNPRF